MFLYNFCVAVYARLIALASLWNDKAKKWTVGRKGIFDRMARTISLSDRIVWIHVASLGEFEQGRPVMEQIKANYPHYKILLTFFSPSGYEVRKNYKGADYIFYMPIDTPRNVRRFLDLAHPEIAIFVKYEFWINYLTQLKRRGTRTFVISAIFRRNSIFFRSAAQAPRYAHVRHLGHLPPQLDLLPQLRFPVAAGARFVRPEIRPERGVATSAAR